MTIDAIAQQLGDIPNSSWIRRAFQPYQGDTAARLRINRYRQFSEGSLSYADTAPGGNASINPKAQFTIGADPNVDQIVPSSFGTGRYYHELIDANAERVHFQFGVPAFNSLTTFLRSFYDPEQAAAANSGNIGRLFYTVGRVVGFVVFWPITATLGFVRLLHRASASALKQPFSRYYYVKPAMPLYWSSANVIANGIAVNMGLVQGAEANENEAGWDSSRQNFSLSREGGANDFSQLDREALASILPSVYQSNGGIDIRRIASRYQVLNNAHHQVLSDIYTDAANRNLNDEDVANRIRAAVAQLRGGARSRGSDIASTSSFEDYIELYRNTNVGQGIGLENDPTFVSSSSDQSTVAPEGSTAAADDAVDDNAFTAARSAVQNQVSANEQENPLENPLFEHLSGYDQFLKAELAGGSSFISYIVNYEQTTSESFTNGTRSSAVADKMNERSAQSRSALFDLSGGNIGAGMVANTIEGIVGGIGSLISGALDTVGLSGLGALGGSAYVDIPDFWENAQASLPTSTYTIELRAPYGHPVSILQNIVIPLSTLLAGALPRSTGRNSYTSPYILKMWHKGRSQSQLNIITEMTINRGVGNVGWTKDGLARAVDVTFTVQNLSKMIHAPITNELGFGDLFGTTMFDEENNFTDYLAILGGLGVVEQYYNNPRWRLRRARSALRRSQFFSRENLTTRLVNNFPGSILTELVREASF